MRKIQLLLLMLALCSPRLNLAWAGMSHIEEVLVQTQHPKQVTFSIIGTSLPSFQIYPLKQNTRFALDLPGVDLSQLPPPIVGEHILLKSVLFETHRGRHLQSPRAIFVFRKAVQYEIKSDENALHFIFTYAGTDKKFKEQLSQNLKNRKTEQILVTTTTQQLQALQQQVARMTSSLRTLKDNFQVQELHQSKEIERIKIHQRKLQQENQNLGTEISNKNLFIKTLNKELQTLKAKQQKKYAEVVSEENKYKSLQNAIARAQKEFSELQQLQLVQTTQNQQLKATIAELKKQERLLQSAQKQVETFLKKQQDLVKSEKNKKTNLQNDVVFLQSEREQQQKIYAQLAQKYNETQVHLNRLSEGINTLRRNREKEQKKLSVIKEKQEKATFTLKGLQNNIADLKIEKRKYQHQLKTLAQQQSDAAERLKSFHKDQKNIKSLQKLKKKLHQEIIHKQDLHEKISQQNKMEADLKTISQQQKASKLKEENKRLEKQNVVLKQLTREQKREHENILTQNQQLHHMMKKEIKSYESALKQQTLKIENTKEELSKLVAETQSKRQEVDELKLSYSKLINTQKAEQEKIANSNKDLIESHQSTLQELIREEKELQNDIERQREQLQLVSIKNEHARKTWHEDNAKRLKEEKQKIEALRLTQQKLKEQITHDLQKQEQEYRNETLSQKRIQEDEIKRLRNEKEALLKEILIHKQQKEELKERAKIDVLQINEKHLKSQKEKNDIITLLTKEKESLNELLVEHKQVKKKNTLVIENQNEKMQALQQQNTALKKQKETAVEKLALVKNQSLKNQKSNTQKTITRSTKRIPLTKIDNLPVVHNRYWQVAPEKIDRSKFGGDSEVKAKEPGRGVLNRLMVVRNKGNMGSKVGLRIDGGARFAITQQSPTSYLIKLFDTRAGNLKVRRILDASDINTTVLRLLPHIEEEQQHRISLRIELRKPTRIQTAQDGELLWLRFDDI